MVNASKLTGHFVYAISDGEWTKIGYSANVRKRLNQLQTANPRPLDCVCAAVFDTQKEARSYESRVRWLAAKHFKSETSGEWIKVNGDLLATYLQNGLCNRLRK